MFVPSECILKRPELVPVPDTPNVMNAPSGDHDESATSSPDGFVKFVIPPVAREPSGATATSRTLTTWAVIPSLPEKLILEWLPVASEYMKGDQAGARVLPSHP